MPARHLVERVSLAPGDRDGHMLVLRTGPELVGIDDARPRPRGIVVVVELVLGFFTVRAR